MANLHHNASDGALSRSYRQRQSLRCGAQRGASPRTRLYASEPACTIPILWLIPRAALELTCACVLDSPSRPNQIAATLPTSSEARLSQGRTSGRWVWSTGPHTTTSVPLANTDDNLSRPSTRHSTKRVSCLAPTMFAGQWWGRRAAPSHTTLMCTRRRVRSFTTASGASPT